MQDELGFKYSKGHVYGDGSIFWRCSKKDKKCKASITTMGNRIIRAKNEHNHFADIVSTKTEPYLPTGQTANQYPQCPSKFDQQ